MRILGFVLLIVVSSVVSQEINGWKISGESYDKTLIGELKKKIADDTYKQINGIVVIRNEKLLIEEYFNGEGRDSLHNPRSVSKTMAGSVLGIAIHEGYLNNVDQTLAEFYDLKQYDHFDAKKSQVKLKHLITMSSGFDGFDFDEKSIGNEENMYPQDNWIQWALNLPMASDRNPGDKWYYFTGGVVLLGDILNSKVPGGLEKYADEKLFKPLGITNYRWQYTPQNVPNTAGGFQLSALDFAKYGQLYKNGGKWKGKQIIPADWVKKSFTKYLPTTVQGNEYGYLWWIKTYKVNGKSYEVYYCTGTGGNKIFVFANEPLVIVVTASAYRYRNAHPQVDEMMEKYIIPAVTTK
ncbi:beta-lactamase family protein [bacterium]|nr:beta-lactamase family protein [bacterium]